jgi:glyoxylase-like metal-dependent hydrolase (beta-lactamase superfamily II)
VGDSDLGEALGNLVSPAAILGCTAMGRRWMCRPHVILVPGHTPGSAALHVPSLDALFVGDAFATYAVTAGARGPQVAPFTADPTEAVASLSRLEEIKAGLCCPIMGIPGPVASRRRFKRYAGSPRRTNDLRLAGVVAAAACTRP